MDNKRASRWYCKKRWSLVLRQEEPQVLILQEWVLGESHSTMHEEVQTEGHIFIVVWESAGLRKGLVPEWNDMNGCVPRRRRSRMIVGLCEMIELYEEVLRNDDRRSAMVAQRNDETAGVN
jgi:hypothetical protein